MDIRVLDNGDLELSLENDDIETVLDKIHYDEVGVLSELTENYWTNGSYHVFDGGAGKPFVGLTSAPCIAESMSYDDNGEPEVEGRLWWFPQYETTNLLTELVEKGKVVFTKAPEPTLENESKIEKNKEPKKTSAFKY
jgi:hypothetical protein